MRPPPARQRIIFIVKRTSTKPHFPSKDEIVAFIGKQPGKVGTREIARAFGLKNADRATLKRMLRELGDEGVVEQPPQEAAPSRHAAAMS